MGPLERLFAPGVEFPRRLGAEAPCPGDTRALHTSYALHSGYERPIHQLGRVTVGGVETVVERLRLASDPRDVLAARDAIRRLLGLPGIEEWSLARARAIGSSKALELSRAAGETASGDLTGGRCRTERLSRSTRRDLASHPLKPPRRVELAAGPGHA